MNAGWNSQIAQRRGVSWRQARSPGPKPASLLAVAVEAAGAGRLARAGEVGQAQSRRCESALGCSWWEVGAGETKRPGVGCTVEG